MKGFQTNKKESTAEKVISRKLSLECNVSYRFPHDQVQKCLLFYLPLREKERGREQVREDGRG